MFRYLTAGESHGQCLVAVVEGLPAGVLVDRLAIDRDLRRRQGGYGRGGRQKIERDSVEILSGVRNGRTLGSPVALVIQNRDWANWRDVMTPEAGGRRTPPATLPRPGHADLAGALKYDTHDLRDILERASARETAARVAVGALAKICLEQFEVQVLGHVLSVGSVRAGRLPGSLAGIRRAADVSPVYCADPAASRKAVKLIDRAVRAGDTLGGIVEVAAEGLPPGLGSHVQWDRRLDGRLAAALMSIQAFKGVEIGDAFSIARGFGSRAHDGIYPARGGFRRRTNRAGGLEGGMTNGERLVVRAAVKPVSTLMRPLASVDVLTKRSGKAMKERSDVCITPAASVVAEASVAIELFREFGLKFGGDSIGEMKRNYRGYLGALRRF